MYPLSFSLCNRTRAASGKSTQSIAYSPAKAATAALRLASLDVFRGLTIAAMILVTDPGTYDLA